MYKTIGIMGGMGPAATVDLMEKIIEMTRAEKDQDHIRILVDNNTAIPDRTAALLSGGEDPVPEMLKSTKCLEAAGADILIIACNTAHCFIDGIEDETDMQIISMPDETAEYLIEKGVRKAAVLATDGTVKSGLYERTLEKAGIEAVYPSEHHQKKLMSLIYDQIKSGITDPALLPCAEMKEMLSDLTDRGAEAMLLACTELPMAFEIMGLESEKCIDPTRVLAAAAIRAAGAEVRPEYL